MPLHYIPIIAIFLAIAFSVQLLTKKVQYKRMRMLLEEEYGKWPAKENTLSHHKEAISTYYRIRKADISPDECVDDITWNDLEMDRVFNCLNHTSSSIGEQLLYCELHKLPENKEPLYVREKTIQFYEDHAEERVDAQMLLSKLKKQPVNYYIPDFVDTLEVQSIPFIIIYRVLQCSLIFLIIASLVSMNTLIIGAASANFLINLTVYALSKTKYEILIESLYSVVRTIKIADALHSSPIGGPHGLEEELKKLKKAGRSIVSIDRRKSAGLSGDIGAIIYDYIMGAFLSDFTVYDKVIHTLHKHKEAFLCLYTYVGEIDMAISIGSFRKSLPHYCIPSFSQKDLQACDIYHPFIDHAVSNDFYFKQNMIITGSNASGKSTFIKAVAVNLILGQNMHTCTASKMTIPDVNVLTSMAIRDDIASGESYYIKEVKYLKRMIHSSCKNRMVFCGIDEILRGTNTTERVAASLSILNYLGKKNCILMVASHDLEIAKALDNDYENCYFCEAIEDGDVVFDYKLRKGINNANNAIRLLQSLGFPDQIVAESNSLINK